jgi:hypothetical protein
MNEIFQENSTPLVQFKLCQVCSIIKSQQLDSFQNVFQAFETKIQEFLQNKTNSTLDSAIKSHLKNLIAGQKKKQRDSSHFLSLKMISNNSLEQTTD